MSLEVREDNTGIFIDELQAAILRGLERVGQAAEGYAKDLCPTGTEESTGIPGYIGGTLKNSITYAVSGGPAAISSYTDEAGNMKGRYSGNAPDDKDKAVYIGTNVEYAPYVELGTVKQAAQPFLKPAATDYGQTYRNIMEDELRNG